MPEFKVANTQVVNGAQFDDDVHPGRSQFPKLKTPHRLRTVHLQCNRAICYLSFVTSAVDTEG